MMTLKKFLIFSVMLSLTACQEDKSSTQEPEPDSPQERQIENQAAQARFGLTEAPTRHAFTDYIVTAFESANSDATLSSQGEWRQLPTIAGEAENISLESGDVVTSEGSGDLFSGTYLQETGVDESDLVKFDGEHIYIVKEPKPIFHWLFPPERIEPVPADVGSVEVGAIEVGSRVLSDHLSAAPSRHAEIRIMAVSDGVNPANQERPSIPPDAQEVNRISIPMSNGNIDGAYLHDDQLTVMSSKSRYSRWNAYHYWSQGAINIQAYDVSKPVEVQRGDRLNIEGYMIGSRRVGDSLVVVARTTPYLKGFVWHPQTEEQRQGNTELLEQLEVGALLPTVSINDLPREPLVAPHQCWLPNTVAPQSQRPYYAPEIITIVTIDLNDFSQRDVVCTTAPTQGIYMSQESLYLFGNHPFYNFAGQDATAIHKFSFQDAVLEYRGSGSVLGSLGWQNPQYRLGEKEGALIVVSNEPNRFGWPRPVLEGDAIMAEAVADEALLMDEVLPPEILPKGARHQLTVLRESTTSRRLETIAQLPNQDDPTPIGKVGEQIYGVRIMGDRAYVVTFERIDPLYVIDIANPEYPRIEGALEIPGFSELLHPIGEGVLLGIGKATKTVNGRTVTSGLKAGLFNVVDPSRPIELKSVILGGAGTLSPISQNPKALSILRTDDEQIRFTLPITLREGGDNTWTEDWQYSGLELFEINGNFATGVVQLDHTGTVKRQDRAIIDAVPPFSYSAVERGIMLNDSVHYIYGEQVWSAYWDSPESALGPQ